MRIQQQLNVYDGKALSGSVVRANNYYLAGNGERASAYCVIYTHRTCDGRRRIWGNRWRCMVDNILRYFTLWFRTFSTAQRTVASAGCSANNGRRKFLKIFIKKFVMIILVNVNVWRSLIWNIDIRTVSSRHSIIQLLKLAANWIDKWWECAFVLFFLSISSWLSWKKFTNCDWSLTKDGGMLQNWRRFGGKKLMRK